jgi:hypothetical protein
MQIKGVYRSIVEDLKNRTVELSQGRAVGCMGFVNEEGYIALRAEIVDGGVTSLPLRKILSTVTDTKGLCLMEVVKRLPGNAVFISTQPGHTGIITGIGVVDMLHIPMVNIGVKEDEICGVGLSYPETSFFDLATESEKIDLKTLQARTIDEEKSIIRQATELSLRYLDVGHELPVVEAASDQWDARQIQCESDWRLPRTNITSIERQLAEDLVRESLQAGQGREVATVGLVDDAGHVTRKGNIVVGGMGMVPPRLLVSSLCAVNGKSLYEIWLNEMPAHAVILHTHPGGTGVMHAGDAGAGPCSWGRPIIAIGHDRQGSIQGATAIELNEKLIELGDKSEELDVAFFSAKTPEDEAEIRNRMFGVSQEYTNLCKQIEIR